MTSAAKRDARADGAEPGKRDLSHLGKLMQAAPLGDQLYLLLEDAIIRCELAPGQRLDEVSLAEHFGVSRIPIREALRALEVAGWIEKRRGRLGTRVRDVTDADLAQLSEVRGVLDAECAALAAERRTPQDLKDLWGTIKKAKTALSRGDRTRLIALNTEFHLFIADCSRNEVFREIISILDKRVRRLLWLSHSNVFDASLDEHVDLVEAIERQDAMSARTIAQKHARRWGVPVSRSAE